MACESKVIPDYLHWNDRARYGDKDFLEEHCVYRLGNPIEFPSTITAYSCNWSFLIKEEDVLLTQDPVRYDDYRYAKVVDIRNFKLERKKDVDDSYLGNHILTCFFRHAPDDCNYSHCEVNITHTILKNSESKEDTEYQIEYTYDNWKKAILNGKSKWFKQLKYDYITEIIKAFCYPLPQ